MPTVELTSGRHYINTTERQITICDGVTSDGVPYNCRGKRVSRDKKYEREAERNSLERGLMELRTHPGYFIIVEGM